MESDEESEATRMFVLESNREFNREFLGRKTFGSSADLDTQKKIRELTLELAETKSALAEQRKLLDLTSAEAKELRISKKDIYTRYERLRKEAETLHNELDRLKKIEREFNEKKASSEFLLQNYRSTVNKFKTWNEFAVKQLEAMKVILVENDKWNTENRYRIYFSYKSLLPVHVTDDEIAELAQGSIMDYKGIDDIDNVDRNGSGTRFLSRFTQTEDSGTETGSFSSMNDSRLSNNNNGSGSALSGIRLSESEFNFLEKSEKIRQLEAENVQLREQVYLARDAEKKQIELHEANSDLKEENRRLQQQLQQTLIEKETMAENVKNDVFSEFAGPSKSAREVIERIEKEKERNDTLFRRTMELEAELAAAKAKIEELSEASETPAPLPQPAIPSNTTSNITLDPEASVVMYHMRDNPLKAAVEAHTAREAAKRRRMESGSTDATRIEELTEENNKLKSTVSKLREQQERALNLHTASATNFREIVRVVTGYDIKMRTENVVEASPVYDKDQFFSLERNGKQIYMLENEYAQQWHALADKYVHEQNLLPMFFASVVLQLKEGHNDATNQ
uniref:DUF4201 domain-containing protein n=1 Tax=Panagrellus redivivus TaxID=6233 RepID=A0A7E4VUE5_PANRE